MLFSTCAPVDVLQSQFLATYAPQLTIRGFSGEFEATFDSLLSRSSAEHDRYRTVSKDRFGSAVTTNGSTPVCDEFIALRHPTFGGYEHDFIACQFVQGDIGGPECRAYPIIDYLAWLLSDDSMWLPDRIRDYLLEGMKAWRVWLWQQVPSNEESELGLQQYPDMGALQQAISKAQESRRFRLTKACLADIRGRFEFSRSLLDIKQPTSELVDRFLEGDFIRACVKISKGRI